MDNKRSAHGGFTLIELLIVVAVIGILAAIAIPAFSDYVRKSRRADAQSVMLDLQLQEEKFRASNSAYSSVLTMPTSDYYTFSLSGVSASGYTINATVKTGTSQVSDNEGGTTCSPLTLNQGGDKGPAACWRK